MDPVAVQLTIFDVFNKVYHYIISMDECFDDNEVNMMVFG
jgi:hypothetical protein